MIVMMLAPTNTTSSKLVQREHIPCPVGVDKDDTRLEVMIFRLNPPELNIDIDLKRTFVASDTDPRNVPPELGGVRFAEAKPNVALSLTATQLMAQIYEPDELARESLDSPNQQTVPPRNTYETHLSPSCCFCARNTIN
jgi:hypothetical protein